MAETEVNTEVSKVFGSIDQQLILKLLEALLHEQQLGLSKEEK